MRTLSLTPMRLKRLQDLISLANHETREQWHGLRCRKILRGQFTATYADIAGRWGVSPGVVYSTIKALVKLGYIKTERLDFCTLITIVESPEPPKEFKGTDGPKETNDLKDTKNKSPRPQRRGMFKPPLQWQNKNANHCVRKIKLSNGHSIRIIPQHRATFRAHRRRT